MTHSTTSLPRLPWTEANALDALAVLRRFGGKQAREARKLACVSCSSSDALHAYSDGGTKCYSCGGAWSNVDAVALLCRLDPTDACREIAQAFGLLVEDLPGHRRRSRPSPLRSAPARPASSKPPMPRVDLELLARINSNVVATLGWLNAGAGALGEAGAKYLSARSIDPDAAGAYGFRTVTPDRWELLEERLHEIADPDELVPTGWFRDRGEGPEFSPPWGGRATALLIPYLDLAGRVVGVRFRNLDARTKRHRYRDLSGVDLPLPFGGEALTVLREEPSRHVLHLVEGELNSWSLRQEGALSVGLPGAGRRWGPGWPRLFGGASRVVLWFDSDEAGRKGAKRKVVTLAESFGRSWFAGKVRQQPLPPGRDCNDLLQAGELAEWLEPARFG